MNPPKNESEAVALLFAALWPFANSHVVTKPVCSADLRLARDTMNAVRMSMEDGSVQRARAVAA